MPDLLIWKTTVLMLDLIVKRPFPLERKGKAIP